MKSIHVLILFISLFFYGIRGNSQSYTPLLNTFNEWHFTTCFSSCLTDIYYTDGDTLVNGKTYKILDGFHYISRTFLIREDVPNKKVYLLLNNASGHAFEDLLYDFSVQVSDTFTMTNPISPFPYYPGDFICDSIISKPLVDGNNYRHFYFHAIDSIQASASRAIWVEGVGSLSLINAPGGEENINEVGSLSCFFKDGQSFYTNLDSIETCRPTYSPSDIQSPELFDTKIIHDFTNKTMVVTSSKFPYQLKIVDIQGRQIGKTIRCNSEKTTIDYTTFSTGLIMLQLEDEHGNRTVIKTVIPN